jgi:predicted nucleic acid-binding protein
MSLSSFLTNPQINLIADASVVINLNATARAADIIKAFRNPFMVTSNACIELQAGIQNGHRDYDQLIALVDGGLMQRVELGAAGALVYESLVSGSTVQTLDDGEAATIAYAHELAGVALIDERKARTICAASFPRLLIASTVELLLHDAVAAALGAEGQVEVMMNALMIARMRVPPEQLTSVRLMIGDERAAQCKSLPRAAREPTA